MASHNAAERSDKCQRNITTEMLLRSICQRLESYVSELMDSYGLLHPPARRRDSSSKQFGHQSCGQKLREYSAGEDSEQMT